MSKVIGRVNLLRVSFSAYCLIGIYSLCVLGQQSNLAPLPIKESLATLRFGVSSLSLCPTDERWVVYQLRDARRAERPSEPYFFSTRTGVPVTHNACDIWIANTETGETKNLTESKGSSWAPVWSPNGEYLAFYSDRGGRANLWLCERLTGRLRQLSNAILRPYYFNLPRWTPDSKHVLVKVVPEGITVNLSSTANATSKSNQQEIKEGNAPNVEVYQSAADPKRAESTQPTTSLGSTGEIDDSPADLALVDSVSGKADRIIRGHVPAGYWVSPDGATIAFLDVKGKDGFERLFDLVVFTISDHSKRIIATGIHQDISGDAVSWSPDGKQLRYVSKGEWFVVSGSGGSPRTITEARYPKLGGSVVQPDLWDETGESFYFLANNAVWKISLSNGSAAEVAKVPNKRILRIVCRANNGRLWSPDNGGSIVVATRDDQSKQVGFYSIELATGKATRLIEEDKEFGEFLIPQIDVAAGSRRLVYVIEDTQHCKDIWSVPYDFSAPPKRVTHSNPIFDNYAMGASRLIEWNSSDGTKLRGALLLPANYEPGKRYPLIVNVYGGEMMSNRVNQFGFSWSPALNMQLLATRGYAVLLPDTVLRVGTPTAEIAKGVLPGVNKVIEMGIADENKLGVMGYSYGGYSTLALIVQTTRFKAAISDAGPANLIGIYTHMMGNSDAGYLGWAESGRGSMGGTLWKYRDRYIENSPLFYLDRVQTPLLIFQGTEDQATSAFLADELFVSLRRLGKEVMYAKYQGEGHTVAFYSYAAQIDYYTRMLAWFDKYLKAPESPTKVSQ